MEITWLNRGQRFVAMIRCLVESLSTKSRQDLPIVAMLILALAAACGPVRADQACIGCHADSTRGFSAGHEFGAVKCTPCHGGDASATDKAAAHSGMRGFPGNLSNAGQSCGSCHPRQVAAVTGGLMNTARGMVGTTRYVFGEAGTPDGHAGISDLEDSPADSLMRRLCAGCHLGRDRQRHTLDPVRDRGGGCLACHINAYPADGHPALSARVQDGRCFGCHSRSGRISLNYAGLAEVDDEGAAAGRLADGRLVVSRPRDVHHAAGMACIDCHTARGLMGPMEGAAHEEQAVDIACADCHDNRNPRITPGRWPEAYPWQRRRVPFAATDGQPFLVTGRHGTPLWHIELRPDGAYLHTKLEGRVLFIPPATERNHPRNDERHASLACEACHSQWAPQCHGCHLRYDGKGHQYDQAGGRMTEGRWVERRWGIRSDLPPLGVGRGGQVMPFIPGMILTAEHPAWDRPLFRRLFAATSPHTTGPSRPCVSCHRSSRALGLGEGRLSHGPQGWRFEAREGPLVDGLPADAWTAPGPGSQGRSTRTGNRPFSHGEMLRILGAHMGGEGADGPGGAHR